MTSPADDRPRNRVRFAERAESAPEHSVTPVPSDSDLFASELDAIDLRLRKVAASHRDDFRDGTDTYDAATVAIVRLAALFDDGDRFASFLEQTTDTERRGIIGIRNIAVHRGYASMNDDVVWETITEQVPAFVSKLRTANGL